MIGRYYITWKPGVWAHDHNNFRVVDTSVYDNTILAKLNVPLHPDKVQLGANILLALMSGAKDATFIGEIT